LRPDGSSARPSAWKQLAAATAEPHRFRR
jgi:hypothetical protein